MIIKLREEINSQYLKRDEYYPVFAVYFSSDIEFMIMVDEYSFPIAVNAREVEISDNRISKFWVYGPSKPTNEKNFPIILSYPEWAEDPFYYQHLVEGKGKAGELFRTYFDKIFFEFADKSLKETALKLKDNWYQCPFCANAWEIEAKIEAVRCPSCHKVLRISNI